MIYYEGEAYSSLSEAATKLGLSQPHLSYLKKTLRLSDEAILEHAMSRRDITGQCGNKKECTVFGTLYASMAEACRVYDVPYISLRTRMSRHNETVEEAIANLLEYKEKRSGADEMRFAKSRLKEVQTLPEPQREILKGFINKLQARGYSPTYFKGDDASYIIRIEKVFPKKRKAFCWVVIGKEQTKLVATDFCDPIADDEKLEVLEMLNTRNAQNSRIKLWLREETNASDLHITLGLNILNNRNYVPPVLTVLKEIENFFVFCQRLADELC